MKVSRSKIKATFNRRFVNNLMASALFYLPVFYLVASRPAVAVGLGSITAFVANCTPWGIGLATLGLMGGGYHYVFAHDNKDILHHSVRAMIGGAFITASGAIAGAVG